MFRTADGAGVEKIFLCGITPTPLDAFGNVRSSFAKVALGAEHTVPWEYRKSTVRLMGSLKKQGYVIYAIEQSARSIRYTDIAEPPEKCACIMGPEVDGLPDAIVSRADDVLEIPMRGEKESLNVSVSFGIVAYQLCRKK
jgi:tRNA G18 (ribose-2'-O)-methylase SpoU